MTTSKTYEYPTKTATIIFFAVPVLYAIGWIISLFLGDQVYKWVINNYDTYHLEYVINIAIILLVIWILTFSTYLIILGTKGYIAKSIPPDGFFIWIKLKKVHGNEAKWNSIVMIIFGIILMGFVMLVAYGKTISYGGDL